MTLLLIVLIVLILVVFLLVIPLEIELSAGFHGRAVFQTRFKYLFGLISWETGGSRCKKIGREKKAAGGDQLSMLSHTCEAIQVKGLWGRMWLLVKRLAGSVSVRSINSDLIISLGDDYYTGMLAGLLIPLVLYLNQRMAVDVSLRPAFEEDLLLEGDLSADFQVRPLAVIGPCLAFACSPQFRRARQIFSGGRCKKRS